MHSNPRKTARSPDSAQAGTSPSKLPRHDTAPAHRDSQDSIFEDAVHLPLSSPVVSLPSKARLPPAVPVSRRAETSDAKPPQHVYAVVNVTKEPLKSSSGVDRRHDGIPNGHPTTEDAAEMFQGISDPDTPRGARSKVPEDSAGHSYATPSGQNPIQSLDAERDLRGVALPRKKLFPSEPSLRKSPSEHRSHGTDLEAAGNTESLASAAGEKQFEAHPAAFSFRPRRRSFDLLSDDSDTSATHGARRPRTALRDIAVGTDDVAVSDTEHRRVGFEVASTAPARTRKPDGGLDKTTAVSSQSSERDVKNQGRQRPLETAGHQTPGGGTQGGGTGEVVAEGCSRRDLDSRMGAEGRRPSSTVAEGTHLPPTQKSQPTQAAEGASRPRGAEGGRRLPEGFTTPAGPSRRTSQDSAFSSSQGSRRTSQASTATSSLAGSRQASLDSSSPSPQGEDGGAAVPRASRVADVVRRVVHARFSAFEERLAARLDGRLARIEARVAAVEDNVDRLRESVQGLTDVLI